MHHKRFASTSSNQILAVQSVLIDWSWANTTAMKLKGAKELHFLTRPIDFRFLLIKHCCVLTNLWHNLHVLISSDLMHINLILILIRIVTYDYLITF